MSEDRADELRLDPESIEALARRVAELIDTDGLGTEPEPCFISAAEVSRRWGVSRRWVYEHADELGVHRLGAGRRPRFRFDPEEVAERLGRSAPTSPSRRPDAQGLAAMRGDYGTDSLSSPSGATVGRRNRKRPGRRANAPRPGAERAAQ